MKKQYTILELPLITEEGQKNAIDKKIECARKIYNAMLDENMKKYREMTKTKEWRELKTTIKEELSSGSNKKSERLKEAYDRSNTILKENGFSEYGFVDQVLRISKYYQKHVSSTMASISIAKPMWSSFEKLLFGNGNEVKFKRYSDIMSLASDNKSGIRFLQDEKGYYVFISNRMAKAKPLKLYVKKPSLYELELLSQKIKIVRIVKRIEKGNRKYYCQLTLEGTSPIKRDKVGEPKHTFGNGKVGIAIWRGCLCAVSDTENYKVSLATEDETFFKEEREKLSRNIEHLRRVGNPQNFNEDGTVKRGIIGADGNKQRLIWYESGNLKKEKAKLKELYRKHSVYKKLHQDKIVLKLLSMGDEFFFADTSFLNTKPEWDEENPLSNSEYKRKKERRRSIQEYAPATLLLKLDMKLSSMNGERILRHSLPEELYWYQHEKGISDKELFVGSRLLIGDNVVDHTMYRAFLSRHFGTTAENVYDQKALNMEWNHFLCNEKKRKSKNE